MMTNEMIFKANSIFQSLTYDKDTESWYGDYWKIENKKGFA